MAYGEKERSMPLQNGESIKIRNKIDAFREKVTTYRREFLRNVACGLKCVQTRAFDKFYEEITEHHQRTMDMREQAVECNDLELLFDTAMPNYTALSDYVDEFGLLTGLWNRIVAVRETFQGWGDILWEKIVTDVLVVAIRELQGQAPGMLRRLPRTLGPRRRRRPWRPRRSPSRSTARSLHLRRRWRRFPATRRL